VFTYYELTFAGIVSLLLAPLIALIAALLVRRRFPSSWPVAAVVLIPALTLGTFLAATRNLADHLWMWLYPDSWQAPAAIALLSILLFAVIRQRGFTRPEAIWMALTSFVIGLPIQPMTGVDEASPMVPLDSLSNED